MSEPSSTETEITRGAREVEQVEQDQAIELAIEQLIDDPVPPGWSDPAAITRRQETLRAAARCAAAAQIELLTAVRMACDRGTRLQPNDPTVSAMWDALVTLHGTEARYRHDALDYTGGEIAMDAMTDEAGAGIATIVDAQLDRLREDLTKEMRALP
jgi:hypothetical protein